MVLEDEALRLIGKAHTEKEFMRLLRENSLDLVIFDSIVPKLKRTNRRLSVSQKPGRVAVKYRIHETQLQLRESDATKLEVQVSELFHTLGIPANIRGYHYLRDGIILAIYDQEMLSSVTKLLYPAIARKYCTTPTRVERAIRHAIEVCWGRGENGLLINIFGYANESERGKPTNSEFIAQLSDRVRLEWVNKSINT